MTVQASQTEIDTMLTGMAQDIEQRLTGKKPLLIGIHTGGVWVAKALREKLNDEMTAEPLGTLNIAYYRDDFTRIGMHPQVSPSNLPFEVDNRHLLLIDDVFFSGRTTRAALNEIFDYGRPASVTLAVLVERNGRELPIRPDITGSQIDLPRDQHIKLTQSEGLQLVVKASGAAHAK